MVHGGLNEDKLHDVDSFSAPENEMTGRSVDLPFAPALLVLLSSERELVAGSRVHSRESRKIRVKVIFRRTLIL